MRKSLAGKLILSMMIIWIPVSAMVITGIAMLSRHITRETIDNQTDKVKYFSAIINADIERVLQSMNQLCSNKAVVDFINSWEGKVDNHTFLLYRDAYITLKEFRNTSMYIDDIYIYMQKTGELLSASRSVITEEGEFQEMREAYLEQGTTFFNYEDDLYYFFQSSNGLMSGIKVSLQDVRHTLRGYDSEGTYEYFFVNAETFHLLGKEESITEAGLMLLKEVDWEGDKLQEKKILGNHYLIYRIGRDANRFLIIMYMNRTDAYATIYVLYWAWIITTFLLLLVPLVLATVIRKIIRRPMNKLQKAMEMVEQEKYNYLLAMDESKEFNYVFAQYNQMTQKVRNLIQEVLEKQVQIEQARYKQLQMQINPHFLFNSLYMGYRMAQAEECEALGDLCMYLGDYFGVLTFVSDDNISVENELKFITTYLRLNRMRFGQKLSWKTEVEAEVEDYRIPPLLLQPLIENSITHGMEKCMHPCMIVVSIYQKDGRLHFIVTDDAGIITEERIEALKKAVRQDKMPQEYFGLWNIQSRLKQLDHANPGICMEKEESGIFRVSFSIFASRHREDTCK